MQLTHAYTTCARSPISSVAIWVATPRSHRTRLPSLENENPRSLSGSGFHVFKSGAPGRIRTCDLLIRSQALYPAELRARRDKTYFSTGHKARATAVLGSLPTHRTAAGRDHARDPAAASLFAPQATCQRRMGPRQTPRHGGSSGARREGRRSSQRR
jgi:hypothetical protein